MAGAIVGSFLATLIVRWPRGEQVTTGRSECDSCRRRLRPAELVPVLSGLASGGKCRSCGAPIDPTHMRIELAAAGLAALALALHPNAQGAAAAAFWLLLLAPAVLDARHYWLPDALTLAVGTGGLLIGGLATGVPLTERLIGGAAGLAGLWLIGEGYRIARGRHGLGAGDPKLLGAIGLWTGWQALPTILLLAALAGLAAAVAQRRSRFDRMPFGTLLVAGAFVWTAVRLSGAVPAGP
ncbi:MAG TPA: prepilin peptidase [Sphingomicrobium sp.]|nr:prepilin peptidase [Sphingomicrobium sp.]